jgi:hypothetical protein
MDTLAKDPSVGINSNVAIVVEGAVSGERRECASW